MLFNRISNQKWVLVKTIKKKVNNKQKIFQFLYKHRNRKLLPRSKVLERRKDTHLYRKQQ